jgi:hypothetical protein
MRIERFLCSRIQDQSNLSDMPVSGDLTISFTRYKARIADLTDIHFLWLLPLLLPRPTYTSATLSKAGGGHTYYRHPLRPSNSLYIDP